MSAPPFAQEETHLLRLVLQLLQIVLAKVLMSAFFVSGEDVRGRFELGDEDESGLDASYEHVTGR